MCVYGTEVVHVPSFDPRSFNFGCDWICAPFPFDMERDQQTVGDSSRAITASIHKRVSAFDNALLGALSGRILRPED